MGWAEGRYGPQVRVLSLFVLRDETKTAVRETVGELIRFELRLKFPLVEIGANKTATLPVLSPPG